MRATTSTLKVDVAHTLNTLLLHLTESLLSYPLWHILCPAVLIFMLGYPTMYSLWMSPKTLLLNSYTGAQWLKSVQLASVAQQDGGGAELVCRQFEVESSTNRNTMSKKFLLELSGIQEGLFAGFQHDGSASFEGMEAFRLEDEKKPVTIFVETPLQRWNSNRHALQADNNTFKTIQRQEVNRKLFSGTNYSDGLVRSAKSAWIVIWSRRSDEEAVSSILMQNIRHLQLKNVNIAPRRTQNGSFAVEFAKCSLLERAVLSLFPLMAVVYYVVAFSSLGSLKSRPGLVVAHAVEFILSIFAAGTVTCVHFGLKFDLLQLPLAATLAVPAFVSFNNTFRLVAAIQDTSDEYSLPLRVHEALVKSVPASGMLVIGVCVVSGVATRIVSSTMFRQLALFVLLSCVFEFFLHLTYFTTALTIDVRKLGLQDLLQTNVDGLSERQRLGSGGHQTKGRLPYFHNWLHALLVVLVGFMWTGTWTKNQQSLVPKEVPGIILTQFFGNARFFAGLLSRITGLSSGRVVVGVPSDSEFIRLESGASTKTSTSEMSNFTSWPSVFQFNVSYFVEYTTFLVFVTCTAYVALKIALASEPAVLDMQRMSIRDEKKDDSINLKEQKDGSLVGRTSGATVYKTQDGILTKRGGLQKIEQHISGASVVSTECPRRFKCRELSRGHFLDVASVTTSNCPFITSVGMDNKILIWSPLVSPIPVPTQLPMSVKLLPVVKVVMSPSGSLIAVFCKCGVVKCWSRLTMSWIWTTYTKSLENRLPLEAFFRTRRGPGERSRVGSRTLRKRAAQASAVAADMARESAQIGTQARIRGRSRVISSSASSRSLSQDSKFDSSTNIKLLSKNSHCDFVIVLSCGVLLTVDCMNGNVEKTSVIDGLASVSAAKLAPNAKILCCKSLCTPRMSDRLVFALSDGSLIVSVAVGMRWRSRVVEVHYGYNRAGNSAHQKRKPEENRRTLIEGPVVIAPVPFVGMIVRAFDLRAQLIDVQSGTIVKEGPIGQFKPESFRVFHPEPSHCRFCGCASIPSFTIAYTELESDTLIIHTFSIDNRAKNSICLRVERDPRETRCLGFASVTEHQHWLRHVQGWLPTDLDRIVGIKRKNKPSNSKKPPFYLSILSRIPGLDLTGLGLRVSGTEDCSVSFQGHKPLTDYWEGFVMTADGVVDYYDIPKGAQTGLSVKKLGPVAKFGHKSIVATFGNVMKVLYLGNDNLIDENNNGEDDEPSLAGVTSNSLSFINRRRRMRLKKYRLTHSTNFNDSVPSSAVSSDTEQ